MRNALRVLWLGLAALFLAGCATMTVNTITNLTPSRLPRKDNGQYMFSVEFASRQRTLLEETVEVSVVLGDQVFPMERTPLVADRWETLVPIAMDQSVVNYHYRIQYDHKAIPDVRTMSTESKNYQVTIVQSW